MTDTELVEFFRAAFSAGREQRITLSPRQSAQLLELLDAPPSESAQQRLKKLLAKKHPWEK